MECAICHGSDTYPHTSSVKVQQGNDFSVNTYPNPFNTGTSIEVTLSKSENITIEGYNVSGQHVKTLVSNKTYSSGKHTFKWDGKNEYGEKAAAGMYLFNIKKGQAIKTVTMIKS